jgi:hypothetical protein
MTSSVWDENKQILFSIVQEQISENNVSELHKHDILELSQHIISMYHKKRFSYPNIVEMNKAILGDISQYIHKQKKNENSQLRSPGQTFFDKKTVQDIPLHKIQPDNDAPFKIENASIQKLHQERLDSFSRDVSKKEEEFQQSMKNAPPNEIDFRDPDQDETFDIDRLLEQELKKRQLEIVPVTKIGNIENINDATNTGNIENINELDMDNNTMKMNVRNEVSEFIKDPYFSSKNSTDYISSSTKSSKVISFQDNMHSNDQMHIDVKNSDHTISDVNSNSSSNVGILNRLKPVDIISNVERNSIYNEKPNTKPLKSILKKPNNKMEMYRSYYIYKTQLSITHNTNVSANTSAYTDNNKQNEFIVTLKDQSVRNFSQSKHIIIESIILLNYPIIPITLDDDSSNQKHTQSIPVIVLENHNESLTEDVNRIFLPSTIQPFLFSGEFCLPRSDTFKIRSLNNDILSFDEICIQYRLL